ncbi:MAG: hypothetical protein KAW94_02795 [Candidatus Thorarchaeota archaeon]|jgi:hypothetical protein|nr:hypothetical protein [Candidatus Thorarchaeota archaeon]
MNRFTSYDSWEEALRDMNEAKYDADRAVLRWQWDDLMPGTFAIRIAEGLLIYTEVLDDYKEGCMKGFVFSKHYSVACSDGELGDAHRATFLAIIPKESFFAAHTQGWTTTLASLTNSDVKSLVTVFQLYH